VAERNNAKPANAVAKVIDVRREEKESSVRSAIVRTSNSASNGSIRATSVRIARVRSPAPGWVRIASVKPRDEFRGYGVLVGADRLLLRQVTQADRPRDTHLVLASGVNLEASAGENIR